MLAPNENPDLKPDAGAVSPASLAMGVFSSLFILEFDAPKENADVVGAGAGAEAAGAVPSEVVFEVADPKLNAGLFDVPKENGAVDEFVEGLLLLDALTPLLFPNEKAGEGVVRFEAESLPSAVLVEGLGALKADAKLNGALAVTPSVFEDVSN